MEDTRDRLLELLLGSLLFTAGLPTLVVYRAAIQSNYQWGMWGITGEGMSAGFFVVLLCVGLAWTAFVLGTRGARSPFTALLILWNALWLGSIVQGIVRVGASRMTLRGDTMGVRIPIAVVGPVLFGGLLLLSVAWWLRRRHLLPLEVQTQPAPVVKILIGIAATLAAVTVLLFVLGDGLRHTNYDRVAVVLVVVQCVLVGMALNPNGNRIPGRAVVQTGYIGNRINREHG